MSVSKSDIPSKDQRTKKSHQKREYQTRARELSLKISVNVLVSIVATVALLKLVPYQLKQQDRLAELDRKTKEEENRVTQLRKNFSRNFDPAQSRKVMQELTPVADPNERQIFFVNNKN